MFKWSQNIKEKSKGLLLPRHTELTNLEKRLPIAIFFMVIAFFLIDSFEDITALRIYFKKSEAFGVLSCLAKFKLASVLFAAAFLLAQIVTYQLRSTAQKIYKDYGFSGNKIKKPEGLKSIYKFSFGLVLSIGLIYLLGNNDQGVAVVHHLICSNGNLVLAVILLLLIFGMTLINPYYTSLIPYQDCKEYYVEYKSFLIPNTFKWSKTHEALNKNSCLTDDDSPSLNSTLFQRLFAISHIWIACAVLLVLRSKYYDVSSKFVTPGFICILSVFGLISIGVCLLFYYKKNNWIWKDPNSRTELNTSILFSTVGFCAISLLFFILGLFQRDNVRLRLDLLIWAMYALLLGLSLFMLFRRRIGYYKGNELCKFFMAKFCDDVNSKVAQGIFSLVIVAIAISLHFTGDDFVYGISSINYILAAIVVFFTVAQLFSTYKYKYLQYFLYEKPSDNAKPAINSPGDYMWRNALAKTIIILILVSFVRTTLVEPNSYFEIFPVKVTDENINSPVKTTKQIDSTAIVSGEITLKMHLQRLLAKRKGDETLYFIANEGGGIRANYWSLLVLKELDKKLDTTLYDRTIATCGASGGAIGQGLYTIMKSNSDNLKQIDDKIDKIGCENFLSRDIFSLLCSTLGTRISPFPHDHKKRENTLGRGDMLQARRYGEMALDTSETLSKGRLFCGSIESFYKSSTDTHSYFPLSIINTTHVESGRRGVVSPLSNNEEVFSARVFVNEFRNEELSMNYMDALFLANRFPFVSPIAKIEEKGNFVDAGVFDNNGLSSLLDIRDYILLKSSDANKDAADKKEWENIKNKIYGHVELIIIENSKQSYFRSEFKKKNFNDKLCKIKSISNLRGNLSGAASTTAFKNYLFDKLDYDPNRDFFSDVRTLSLPYLIENKDALNTAFGGELVGETNYRNFIKEHDSKLIKNLKLKNQFYIEPPLGRVLSEPVKEYMRRAALQLNL